MKILRIIYDWPPPWDGLGPHPYEITVSQAKEGHDITIFCGRWPKAGPLKTVDGVKFYTFWREPLPGTVSLTTSVFLLFKYLLWRRKNTPDIVHSHGHFGIWIYLYRKILHKFFPWASELKVPLVVHFHNTAKGRWLAFEEQGKDIKPYSKFLQWPLAVLSDKLAVATASACIFVSNTTRQEAIEHYGADPRRCFVVETGVNTELFTPVSSEEKEKSRKDLGLDVYDIVVLNHGKMVARKNILLLVEMLQYLPKDFKLLLVGSGDPSYMQQIQERIKDLYLSERVLVTGYTPYPQVPIAYQVSDLFILLSTWEGLPKVVMQGLACSIPCLVSGFRLSDELEGLFYTDSTDPKQIAELVKDLISKRPTVDVNRVRLYYSWDHKVKEIDKIYDFAKKYPKL